jgi:hypothetical protein
MPYNGTSRNPVASSPLGDRRRRVRLEVVGALWGVIEVTEPARILEISAGGALIASPVAAAPDSIRVVMMNIDGVDIPVDVRVRHLRTLPASDDAPLHYLLGVEFLSPPPALTDSLE